LVSTLATDLGNTVVFSSLLLGGALHVFAKESVSNAVYLHDYFSKHPIDCLKIVASHWRALSIDEKLLLPVKLLIFGGEALPSRLIETIRLSGTHCQVVNHYGPTETTIGKLLHLVDWNRQYNATIPIGKPFSNTRVYVLSKELQLCPVGVPGQLYIAGDGVARGYLNNPELTKEKFIKNPFDKEGSSLMYGTGDLVKYLSGGDIEFIGRVDEQVKIRGYRIEPGEIASVLEQSDLVKQAVVLAKEDNQGNKRLIGYVVAEGGFDKEGITGYLKERLPEYMIPANIMELDSLPLTANGKIDRQALPDPDATEPLSDQYMAPRNAAEEALASIWQDVLGLEQVGIHDDFFELGGDSIITIQVVSRARRMGYELQVGDIFSYTTIARLSALLEQRADNSLELSGEQGELGGTSGLLPIQQWYLEREVAGISHFNQSVLLKIDKTVSSQPLKAAIKQLTSHHDALRFKYYQSAGKWQQSYGLKKAH
jgi:aryl carrier-like protein